MGVSAIIRLPKSFAQSLCMTACPANSFVLDSKHEPLLAGGLARKSAAEKYQNTHTLPDIL